LVKALTKIIIWAIAVLSSVSMSSVTFLIVACVIFAAPVRLTSLTHPTAPAARLIFGHDRAPDAGEKRARPRPRACSTVSFIERPHKHP
jgi:hypothetical protein